MHGTDLEGKLKKSDVIKLCIKESGINDLQEICMVGDSKGDAIGAEKAGIDFIAVTYGFGYKSNEDINDVHCAAVANNTFDLLKIIKKDEKK